jgi:hypothetical protein
MDVQSIVPLIVPVVTALGVIGSQFKTAFDNGRKLDKIEKKVDLTSRDIHRLTLHDEHLPIEERIDAGQRYVDLGGNGSSLVYLDALKQQYEVQLKKGNKL